MDKKDQKFQRILELAKIADALTATQAREYVQLLVSLTQKQKEALVKEFQSFADKVSQETYQKIKEGVDIVSEKHKDAMLEVRQLSNKQKKAHEEMMVECMKLLEEIKSIEVKDGEDADEEVIVEKVLSQIKLPEIKEVVLDNAEQLRDKLETLEGEDRLDAKAIKNLPESVNTIMAGAGGRLLSQMNDVDTTGIANNYILKWNSTRGIWEVGANSGGGGSSSSIYNEVPSGLVNGSNTTFTTSQNFTTNTTRVYLNGLRQKLVSGVDYTESGNSQIIFNSPPAINDIIVVDYEIYSVTPTNSYLLLQDGTNVLLQDGTEVLLNS